MAIVTTGVLISEIRGKVGDLVFLRTRGGLAVRAKGTLIDANSPAQQFVRNEIIGIVQAWQSLSPEIQHTWYLSALNFHYHNNLNKRFPVSGYGHFVSSMAVWAFFNTGAFSNLVVNGGFDSGADWNTNPPWQINTGELKAIGGSPNVGSTTQAILVEPSIPIIVTFDITLNTISAGQISTPAGNDSIFNNTIIGYHNLGVGSYTRERVTGSNPGVTKLLEFAIPFAITGNLSIDNYNIRLIVPDPPQPGDMVPIKTLSVTANNAAQSLDVTYSPSPTDSGMHYIIWGTPALSPGINNPGSSYRIIGIREGNIASPDDIVPGYLQRIGAIGAVGQKIFVSMECINLESQQRAVPVVASTIIT
ncbi:hypothetical protein KAR91_78385 [Candidatus Pacearchaeota archaeon]|nr:hypothetical protein [Candidatus Pacearchaeota archaeon]